jgi:predicted transcriptional regulator
MMERNSIYLFRSHIQQYTNHFEPKMDKSVDKKYREFKEGYNCFPVSNEEELIELLNKSNIDTAKVVENAKKLMKRHVNISKEWSKITLHG